MKGKIQRILNSLAKGMIYGNVVNSNGGGVWIGEALLQEELS